MSPGFAKDYNLYLARHSQNPPRLPEGLFLAFSIFGSLSWIPLAFATNLILGPIMAARACGAANRLAGFGSPDVQPRPA